MGTLQRTVEGGGGESRTVEDAESVERVGIGETVSPLPPIRESGERDLP